MRACHIMGINVLSRLNFDRFLNFYAELFRVEIVISLTSSLRSLPQFFYFLTSSENTNGTKCHRYAPIAAPLLHFHNAHNHTRRYNYRKPLLANSLRFRLYFLSPSRHVGLLMTNSLLSSGPLLNSIQGKVLQDMPSLNAAVKSP